MEWDEKILFYNFSKKIKYHLIENFSDYKNLLIKLCEEKRITDDEYRNYWIELYENDGKDEVLDKLIEILGESLKTTKKIVGTLQSPYFKEIINNLNDVKQIWYKIINIAKGNRVKDISNIRYLPFEDSFKTNINELFFNIKVCEEKSSKKVKENNVETISFFETHFKEKFKKIIVQGGTGIGKTIHVNHLLYEWATKNLKKFEDKLILVIYLRDVTNHSQIDFQRIIKDQNFQDNDYVTIKMIKNFLRTHKDKIIIFIDGADEFYYKNHILNNYIIKNQYEISTVIWCRKWKTVEIKNNCKIDKIFEINGLKEKDINLFFQKFLSDNKEYEYFMENILKNNEYLMNLCKSPFFLRIIYLIYVENKNLQNQNLYTIYEYVVEFVIRQHNSKKIEFVRNFLEQEFTKICFLNSNQMCIIFEKSNQQYQLITDYLINLLDGQYNRNIQKYEIKFFHNSFQQFFAAKYLYNLIIQEEKLNETVSGNLSNIEKSRNILKTYPPNIVFHILNFLREKSLQTYKKFLENDITLTKEFQCSEKIFKDINNYETSISGEYVKEEISNYPLKILIQTHGYNWESLIFQQCYINSNYTKNLLIDTCTANLTSLIIKDPVLLNDNSEIDFFDCLEYFRIKNLKNLEFSSFKCNMVHISENFQRNSIYSTKQLSVVYNNDKIIINFIQNDSLTNEYLFMEISRKNYNFNPSIFLEKLNNLNSFIIRNYTLEKHNSMQIFQTIQSKKDAYLKIFLIDCLLIDIDKEFFENCLKFFSNKYLDKNSISIKKYCTDSYQFLVNSEKHQLPNCFLTSDQIGFQEILDGLEKNYITIQYIDISIYNNLVDNEKLTFLKIFVNYLKNTRKLDINQLNYDFSPFLLLNIAHEINFIEKIYITHQTSFISVENKFFKILEQISNVSFLQYVKEANINFINDKNIDIYKKLLTKINLNTEVLNLIFLYIKDEKFDEIFKELSFSNLKTIKFYSGNITDIKAKIINKLLIGNDNLKNVDFSRNTIISQYGFVNILKGLEKSFQHLSKFDLSFNNISENQSCTLGDTISHCIVLNELDLSFNPNMGNGFEKICNGLLSSHSKLEKINLSGCQLDKIQAIYLSKFFKSCKNLSKVNLNFNSTLKEGFKEICESLKSSAKCLKEIQFCCCRINKRKSQFIADLLQECYCLEEVNLSMNNGINEPILTGLKNSGETIKKVNFSGCELSKEISHELFVNLQNYSKMEELLVGLNMDIAETFHISINGLKLSNIKILDFQACNLKETKNMGIFLKSFYHLEKINFSWNFLSKNALQEICNGLYSSVYSLKTIYFSNCKFEVGHGKILHKFFNHCLLLENIDLSYNKSILTGFKDIFDGLHNSSTYLKYLNLAGCCLDIVCCKKLNTLLRKCSLREFDMNYNKLTEDGLETVLSGLKYSKNTLNVLKLSDCNINGKMAIHLGKFLKECNILREINIANNLEMKKEFNSIISGLQSSCENLLKLDFRQISMEKDEVLQLESFLTHCSSLQLVHLSDCYQYMSDNFKDFCKHYTKSTFLDLTFEDGEGLICCVCQNFWLNPNSTTMNHRHTICIDCLKRWSVDVNVFLINSNELGQNEQNDFVKFYLTEFFENFLKNELHNEFLNLFRKSENLCTICSSSTRNDEVQKKNKKRSRTASCHPRKTSQSNSVIPSTFDRKETVEIDEKPSFDSKKQLPNSLQRSKSLMVDIKENNILPKSLIPLELKDRTVKKSGIRNPCKSGKIKLQEIDFESKIVFRLSKELINQSLHRRKVLKTKFEPINKTYHFSPKKVLRTEIKEKPEKNVEDLSDDDAKSFIFSAKECNFFHDFISKDEFYNEKDTKYRLCNNSIFATLKLKILQRNNKFCILFNSNLNEKDASAFNNLLKKQTIIEGFCFLGLRYMENEFKECCRYLTNSKETLKVIDLSQFNLDYKNCLVLESLLKVCKIEEIDLTDNWNMGSGFNNVCIGLLPSKDSLKRIILENCSLDDHQFNRLENLFKQCTCLETVSLKRNKKIHSYAFNLDEALENSSAKLKHINLDRCMIRENVGESLRCLLQKCNGLISIYISGYQWKGTLLIEICKSLMVSSNSLREISIAHCDEFSFCNTAIAKLFRNCSHLEKIKLDLKFLSGDYELIQKSLEKSSKTLRIFDVSNCSTSNEKVIKSTKAIFPPNSLKPPHIFQRRRLFTAKVMKSTKF